MISIKDVVEVISDKGTEYKNQLDIPVSIKEEPPETVPKLKTARMSNSKHRPYACLQCNARYRNKHHLNHHMKFECNKEPRFPCAYCSKKFKRNSDLRRHLRDLHKLDVPLLR